MSNKMEQSLDDILKASKSSKRGRGGRRSNPTRAAATAGPVGGVSKSTRHAKPAKATPTAPAAAASGETKIMVSNLPLDVEQGQLQEYFANATGVGRPKRILLQYGPNGRSLGSATITFSKHEQAVKATASLNGVKIDNRPIRVEMLVSAANLPPPARQPTLAERVTQPRKDKPKPATAEKAAAGRGRGDARGKGRGGRGGRERQKKKTTEDLDAEMADYFTNTDGAATAMDTNGAAQATAGGDIAMGEEML
ncbi:hypothetical protein IQ07DRAFT_643983 [Pyrenochaeta sp. DS3sAY3a]|nr:hypothetical protein IQ07DRAFT_643983 [Pyrenochaeta sp. DS3sAY3a]